MYDGSVKASGSNKNTKSFDDYDVREAIETLARAEKVRKNRPLMVAVKAEAKRRLAAVMAK